jgi:hypothetical protein
MNDQDLRSLPSVRIDAASRAKNETHRSSVETADYRAAIAKHRDTSLRYGISRSIDRDLWEVLDDK